MGRRTRGEGTVTKRKDGRFEAAVYVNTPMGIKRVRRYAHTRSAAETLLVSIRNSHDSGVLTYSKERKLGEFLDYWLLVMKPSVRPNTLLSYEPTVRLYLKPALGHKLLTRLTVADVQSHFDSQIRLGRSSRNIQKQKIVLAAALKRAEQEDFLTRNVARLAKIPPYQPKSKEPWSFNELNTFLKTANNEPLYPVFVLLSMYGLRISEVLGLTWQDIDMHNKVIHVRQQLQYIDKVFELTDLKTDASNRDLPLLDTVFDLLKNIERTQSGTLPDLIFKNANGNPIDRHNVRRAFKRISKKAVLPEIKLHYLRHTAATNLKNMGIQVRDTQLILGHAHVSTTQQIYQHSGIEERTQILSQYEQKLVAISGSSRQSKPSVDFSLQIKSIDNRGNKRMNKSVDYRLMSPVL